MTLSSPPWTWNFIRLLGINEPGNTYLPRSNAYFLHLLKKYLKITFKKLTNLTVLYYMFIFVGWQRFEWFYILINNSYMEKKNSPLYIFAKAKIHK